MIGQRTTGRGLSRRRSELRTVLHRTRIRAADSAGVTISEMLVVLAILGIVLAGMTTLFLSASNTEKDQSNRYQAQQTARNALDALRRELRCASSAAIPSAAELRITLPGYCQRPVVATAADFTWCVTGVAAPYVLWRYVGSSCSGTGVRKAESLSSSAVFSYNRAVAGPVLATPVPGSTVADGFFKPGTYAYTVTAVTSNGEVSGSIQKVTISASTPNQITLSWAAYTGAVSYNIYGRDDGTTTTEGLRLIGNTTTTSFVDLGCSTPAEGCSPAVIVNSSLRSPPLAIISFSVAIDLSTADGRQRFTVTDDVVLRNSGRY